MTYTPTTPLTICIPPFSSPSDPTVAFAQPPSDGSTGGGSTLASALTSAFSALSQSASASTSGGSTTTTIQPAPMSSAAFAPFGSVIALNDAPVAIEHSYLADTGAVTGISLFRATQKVGLERGKEFDVRLMERHPYTSQVFIPMGKAEVSY